MRKKISLKKWLLRYWIAMFLLMLTVYLLTQQYMMNTLTARKEESVHREIIVAEDGIEQVMDIVDCLIYEAFYNGVTQTPTQLYKSLQYETDPLTFGNVTRTTLDLMNGIVSWSDMINFTMLMVKRDEETRWLEVGDTDSYGMRVEFKKKATELLKSGRFSGNGQYTVVNTDAESVIVRVMRIEDGYLVVGIPTRKIIEKLQVAGKSENVIAFAAQATGEVIFASSPVNETLLPANEGVYISVGEELYLQSGYISPKTGLYFGMLTLKQAIMSDIVVFQLIFFALLAILMLVVPVSFVVVVMGVQKPIIAMSKSMDHVAEGDLDTTVKEDYSIKELALLTHAFNHLIERIKKLKIEKYEVQLSANKANMQYLQLQIKPHFYTNLLNIVYSLAEQKDFATIQKMSSAVVAYSRYMYEDACELVELKRELEHIHYYMEIQKIRYGVPVCYTVQIDESLHSAMIPPFLLQSFVENTMKYVFGTKKETQIKILAFKDVHKQELYFEIRDNGEGYTEKVLNQNWDKKVSEGHIGLANIFQRLKLIYGEKAQMQLLNDEGAVARIQVPYIAVDNIDFDTDDI